MIKSNKQIMKQGKCSVCNHHVMIDEIGNGDMCQNCGWKQDSAANEMPDNVWIANPISLNKARQLFKEKKPLTPDFEDFIEFYEMYGEVEFYCKGKRYGVFAPKDTVILFECDVSEPQIFEFTNIDDFIANARIDGVLIKDLWEKIKSFNCLS